MSPTHTRKRWKCRQKRVAIRWCHRLLVNSTLASPTVACQWHTTIEWTTHQHIHSYCIGYNKMCIRATKRNPMDSHLNSILFHPQFSSAVTIGNATETLLNTNHRAKVLHNGIANIQLDISHSGGEGGVIPCLEEHDTMFAIVIDCRNDENNIARRERRVVVVVEWILDSHILIDRKIEWRNDATTHKYLYRNDIEYALQKMIYIHAQAAVVAVECTNERWTLTETPTPPPLSRRT